MQVPVEQVIQQWNWSDKYETSWRVSMTEGADPLSFEIYAESASFAAPVCFIDVRLYDKGEKARISANIADWRVPSANENRGIGSMLLREAILECRHRGVNRITGDLVGGDKDDFEKLEYLYTTHGFTVDFFDADKVNRNPNKDHLGEVELIL